MSSIFKPKMPELPTVKPLPETPSAELSPEEEARIQKEQAAIERKRKGYKSTILTSPLGIQESEETKLKTLLGE
jgi:hypothetical protein